MGCRPEGDRPGHHHPVTDFVVIGGGIAGVSAAAHLAPHGSVTLVEMEPALAYHPTGRSAALFVVNYGAQGNRPLAKASQAYLENPPDDTLLLVICGKVDKATRNTKWVKALDHLGVVSIAYPVTARDLTEWITQRLQTRGLVAE